MVLKILARPRVNRLLLVASIAVLSGIALTSLAPYIHERNVARKIEQIGGRVEWTVFRPEWMPTLIGDEWLIGFQHVTQVDLGDTKATDSDAKLLQQLPHVCVAYFGGSNITDAGLVHISSMPNLKYLCLDETRVTDSGMRHISQMPPLHSLGLNNTNVGDDGIELIKTSTDLYYLGLENTRVSNSMRVWVDGHINSRIYTESVPE